MQIAKDLSANFVTRPVMHMGLWIKYAVSSIIFKSSAAADSLMRVLFAISAIPSSGAFFG